MPEGKTRAIGLEQAQAILERWVRPAVRSHAGDVRVLQVSAEGDVLIEFSGACAACPLQPVTFGTAVRPAFADVEGVRHVLCHSVRVSTYAMKRMTEMMQNAATES